MSLIRVGQIINTHGIRGELKVLSMHGDITRFQKLKTVYVGDDLLEKTIVSVRFQKGFVYLRFQEHNNINEVLSLKGLYLSTDEDSLPILEDDEYYIFQLQGCDVIEDGQKIGILEDVIKNNHQDVYVIRKIDNQLAYVPAVTEFIKDIDLNNRVITISSIEGLI